MKENDKQFLEAVEESKRRLADGENPKNVFDWCGDFHDGFAVVGLNGKRNYIDHEGNYPFDTWFDWCRPFNEGFAQVRLNGKFNFIDRNGNYLSDTWFDSCRPFNEGFARVELNGKCNYIDHEGNYPFDTWFDWGGDFHEGFAEVKLNDEYYHPRKDGVLCGYNTKEPIKIEDKQMKGDKDNFIAAVEKAKKRLASGEKPEIVFDKCWHFYWGFARVQLNEKYNFIGYGGNYLSDVWFDWCWNFQDGVARVALNGKWNLINCNGSLLFDTWLDWYGSIKEGLALVKLNGKWNFINREGNYLSDVWFDDCWCFNDGFAHVKLNGKDYHLRKDGVLCDFDTKEPIKTEDKQMKENKDNFTVAVEEAKRRLADGENPKNVFDWCGDFHEGFAAVVLNEKCNYIDHDGNYLSDTWFDFCWDFYEGLARVELNDKYNFIGRNGNYLSDTWFDYCCVFYDGFAAVEMNEKWNFIDHNGNILSDKWFNYCGNFSEEFGRVKLNGKDYYVRKDGVLCDYNTKEPIKPGHSVSSDTDYKEKYEQALERARNYREGHTLDVNPQAAMEYVFPELNESEDEKVRKRIIRVFKGEIGLPTKEETKKYIAWLEKQGRVKHTCRNCQTFQDLHQNCPYSPIYQYTDLTEAHKHLDDETPCEFWLEKQGGIDKLSEEEQNSIAYGVITSCAMAFIDYLDAHKYEGKMCVSNGECEDIENAFHNGMFDRLHRYYCKYIEKQGEQEQLYIRFGEIPTDEKSKIYQGETEVGTENGVSVYPAFRTNEGNIVLGLSLPITKTTLYTQQHLIEYDNRPCYLVKGDYVGKDTDGQPLINNVSIIKKLDNYRAKEEKQGEQKPTDKTEPKFKVGDWIVTPDIETKQIEKVTFGNYWFTDKTLYNIIDTDNKGHLWTIHDAKDGDIIVTPNNNMVIYNCNRGPQIWCYCGLYYNVFNSELNSPNGVFQSCCGYMPATKEQRDFLFSKMKEAGYEWDAEKRELRKVEQNPAWSEEDEIILDSIIEDVMPCGEIPDYPTDEEREYFYEGNRKVDWLKSIKERIKGE